MARIATPDLAAEMAKPFQATIDQGVQQAFDLGHEAPEAYLATYAGMTCDQARRQLQRDRHRGQRPSRSAGGAIDTAGAWAAKPVDRLLTDLGASR